MNLVDYASIATIVSCLISLITLCLTLKVKSDVKEIKKNISNSNVAKGVFGGNVRQSINNGVNDD